MQPTRGFFRWVIAGQLWDKGNLPGAEALALTEENRLYPVSTGKVRRDHNPLKMSVLIAFSRWGYCTNAGGMHDPSNVVPEGEERGRREDTRPVCLHWMIRPLPYLSQSSAQSSTSAPKMK